MSDTVTSFTQKVVVWSCSGLFCHQTTKLENSTYSFKVHMVYIINFYSLVPETCAITLKLKVVKYLFTVKPEVE